MQAKTRVRDLFIGMNKTEKEFAIQLEAKKRAGLISEWHYEGVTFKLADDCRYTPDFMVIENDGVIGFDETKGWWREDAKIKIKVAATQLPFRFTAHVLSKGKWTVEDFTLTSQEPK
jgi:hypothetical protein